MVGKAAVDIVEDDEPARSSLSGLCEAAGYHVRLASSAEEYLRWSRVDAPCCVIVDLWLPGISGLELLKHLRRPHLGLPAIAMSGRLDVDLAVQSLQAGALTVIQKPAAPDELLEAIDSALELSRELASFSQLSLTLELLSNRERAVLDMLADGELYKSIAQRLDVGIRTVERIRERILKKTAYSAIPPLVRDVGILQGLMFWRTREDLFG